MTSSFTELKPKIQGLYRHPKSLLWKWTGRKIPCPLEPASVLCLAFQSDAPATIIHAHTKCITHQQGTYFDLVSGDAHRLLLGSSHCPSLHLEGAQPVLVLGWSKAKVKLALSSHAVWVGASSIPCHVHPTWPQDPKVQIRLWYVCRSDYGMCADKN